MNSEFENIILSEYSPYGELEKQYNNSGGRLKYIGKERDHESGDANHGVRQYSQKDARFYCPDVLFEKYYDLSPYQYSLNNPISFQDGNGAVVKAVDKASQDNIRNSVELEYQHLVQFKDDGTAFLSENPKVAPPAVINGELVTTNIAALSYMINHKDIIEVVEIEAKKKIKFENRGEIKETALYIELTDNRVLVYNGMVMVGQNKGYAKIKSTTENHKIAISGTLGSSDNDLSDGWPTKGSITAHELYGHLIRFMLGIPYTSEHGAPPGSSTNNSSVDNSCREAEERAKV